MTPMMWEGDAGIHLLGEARVVHRSDATRIAKQIHNEAAAIWADSQPWWHVMLSSDTLHLESIRVDRGPFNTSGVLLIRANATISHISALELYRLMTSPEGFQIIDPHANPEEFHTHKETYTWRRGQRLEISETLALLPPPFSTREFCVLDAYDERRQTFVSKSIQHPSMPGSSSFANGGPPPNGMVRALNSFALRTSRGRQPGTARLELINYADLRFSPTVMNWLNVNFLPGLVQRLQYHVTLRSHSRGSSPG